MAAASGHRHVPRGAVDDKNPAVIVRKGSYQRLDAASIIPLGPLILPRAVGESREISSRPINTDDCAPRAQ
jgi:hypothetical protein